MGALESALAAAEDETDVIALKSAKAEAVADMEEFDENVPLGEEGTEQSEQPELSKAEQEVHNLVQQVCLCTYNTSWEISSVKSLK